MIPCPACSRFVRSTTVRCPFCDAVVRDGAPALGTAVVGALLGLGVPACSDPKDDTPTSTTSTDVDDFGVAAYGGPDSSAMEGPTSFDDATSASTTGPSDDTTSSGTAGTGTDSSSGTAGADTTSADTGPTGTDTGTTGTTGPTGTGSSSETTMG